MGFKLSWSWVQIELELGSTSLQLKEASARFEFSAGVDVRLPDFIEVGKSRAYMAEAFDQAQAFNVGEDSAPTGGELYVLVSFSMPEELLRSYNREALRIGATVVLNGLIDDDFEKTLKAVSSLSIDEQSAFSIDPTLFSRLAVEAVPTFVLAPKGIEPCAPAGCPLPDVVRAHGAVSIRYFLESVDRLLNGVEQGAAKGFLNAY